jgi:hypothetical protein
MEADITGVVGSEQPVGIPTRAWDGWLGNAIQAAREQTTRALELS